MPRMVPYPDWLKKLLEKYCPDVDTSQLVDSRAIRPLYQRCQRAKEEEAWQRRAQLMKEKQIVPGTIVLVRDPAIRHYIQRTVASVDEYGFWVKGQRGYFSPKSAKVVYVE